jgi:hypothetical protein
VKLRATWPVASPTGLKWEAKKLRARHVCLDAERSGALLHRVLERRFLRGSVDLEVDRALTALLAKLSSIHNDSEFLTGDYCVVKTTCRDSGSQTADRPAPLPRYVATMTSMSMKYNLMIFARVAQKPIQKCRRHQDDGFTCRYRRSI